MNELHRSMHMTFKTTFNSRLNFNYDPFKEHLILVTIKTVIDFVKKVIKENVGLEILAI